MVGALIGDIVGSIFEYNNLKTKDFELFSTNSSLTDDSIMTLAVAEILQNGYIYDKDKIIDTLKKWSKNYLNASYSKSNNDGKGIARIISPVGWYARTEEEVKEFLRRIIEATYPLEEDIKGAEVTAMSIFYARKGKTKEFIKEYVERYYDLNFNYEELKQTCYHGEKINQNIVPQAVFYFLISESFEDCLRKAVGGDRGTATISCAIAEAYYKVINPMIKKQLYACLPKKKNKFGLSNPKEIVDEMEEYSSLSIPTFEEVDDNTIFLKCVIDKEIQWLHLNKIHEMMEFIIYGNSLFYTNQKILEQLRVCYEYSIAIEIVKMMNEVLKNNEMNMVYYLYKNKVEAIIEKVNEIEDKEQFYKDLF